MQKDFDVRAVVGEAVLVVADVLHHAARDLGDQVAIDDGLVAVLLKQRSLTAAFAGDAADGYPEPAYRAMFAVIGASLAVGLLLYSRGPDAPPRPGERPVAGPP